VAALEKRILNERTANAKYRIGSVEGECTE
jgi:hypothetical protein